MKDHIKSYMDRLGKAICESMSYPVNERSASAVREMSKCWMLMDDINARMKCSRLTAEEIHAWVDSMENSDGTTGHHWTMDQTTDVARSMGIAFEHITPCEWYAAMNMVYSDGYKTAARYGLDTPEYYAHQAEDFLFDDDGPAPAEKLALYYRHIVCHKC